jgi:hypothetical protein
MNKPCAILFLLLMAAGIASGKEKLYLTHGQAAAELAIWKPSDLDDHPSKPFENVKGGSPQVGVSLTSPSLLGFSLRVGAHRWSQTGLEDRGDVESVHLQQVSLEIKNQLVAQARISPYVAYGVCFFWGREDSLDGDANAFDQIGRGVNIGAGVDFALLRHWGFAAEYQYIYTDLEEKIGISADYSGPKVACKLLYIF